MNASFGTNHDVAADATVGYQYSGNVEEAEIGNDATIRSGSVIYADVSIGDGLVTGHHVLIREQTVIGDDAVIGTKSVLDGRLDIGDDATLETDVYVPPGSTIGDRVFVGPCAVFTNDPYPQRFPAEYEPRGPTLGNDVSVGANATLLPNVEIGDGAMIGAGAVVTCDVPSWHLAIGNPATVEPLPERLRVPNGEAVEQ
jgi:acetyltransferase-like isoleucine patch superfamily enzyme